MLMLSPRHLLTALLLLVLAPLHGADSRPNFLLIIADDLNARDLGFTGNTDIHTPNLDRLRSEGVWLRNMFNPATTCSPTRHALYTGVDCIRSGAYPNHTRVYDGTKSMFTYFKALGYRVGLQAKTHVGPKDRYDPAKLKIPPYLHDNAETRRLLAAYYAEITSLDSQVGAVLKVLEDGGQAGNTVVVFVSEQGSSFPYGGKWSVYDTGTHTATVVRWPGRVKPGSTNDAILSYLDIPPTFLAAAGEDPAKIDTGCPDAYGYRGFDGKSFLDVLHGRSQHHRDIVFAQHTTVGIIGYRDPYPMRSARDARYKYVRNLAPQNTYEIGGIHKGEPLDSWKVDAQRDPKLAARIEWLYHRPAEELYDTQTDEYEFRNLAADPAYAAIKARLAKELDAWMAQQGDKGLATEMIAHTRQGDANAERNDPAKRGQDGASPPKKGKKKAQP
jgi:uncharacterized sulfatase